MKKQLKDLTVKSIEWLSEVHILLKLHDDANSMPEVVAGQFVEVKVENSQKTFLRRPISINFVDYKENDLWLLVAVVGDGTKHISELKVGEKVNVMMPLGNGFPISNSTEECLLVGGGVGIAPLLYLGKVLKDKGHKVTYLLGSRNAKGVMMMDEFKKYGDVLLTTEDGSLGEKGFVTNHSIWNNKKFSKIYVCGPTPMMKAVAKVATEKNTECYVSLENKMACGLGACLCCVTEDKNGHNRCVCTEGPVFNINELPWQI